MSGHLSPYQFKVTRQRSGHEGHVTTVSAWPAHEGGTRHVGENPVGMLQVTHAGLDMHTEQAAMSDWEEGPDQEEGLRGQQRWTGGNMSRHPHDDVTHVNWLHASNPHVLRGLIGQAAVEIGQMPHADQTLTEQGSRISRGMNRRIGLPAHPYNQSMKATEGPMSEGTANMVSRNIAYDTNRYHGEVTRDVPTAEVEQNTRAVFAKPPWVRTPRTPAAHQPSLFD